MLLFIIFISLSVLIRSSNGINLTYIVKKEAENLAPSCIMEENERYAAIGWIYPLPKEEDQEPNITTRFEPDIHNGFNCKFRKHDKCNRIWAIKNWKLDENSTRTLELLFDDRWEDFPTVYTSKNVKDFKERFEIPNSFKLGLSIRATNNVELLLCEGWNPHTYPCYHLNISQTKIFLRKYTTLPECVSLSDSFLDSYGAFSNILSAAEWRNFVISRDNNGVLSLDDVSANRTAIRYEDKNALKPLYLLMRSNEPALWKIHQNNFMYTNESQISRLGPILNIHSKDLCVALYVSVCESCEMSFFVMKGNQRHVLLEDRKWRLVKLKDNKVETDRINIFVETKFVNRATNREGFWAVDNVRVCDENEVKVTFLKMKNAVKEDDDVSCQVIEYPKWRPKQLVYDQIQSTVLDFPTIDKSSNSTSITLNWTQEHPSNQISYFITYEANDICTEGEALNLKRIKSNGFLMTKHNEVVLGNLVPFTKYNISFSSILHENKEQILVSTQETVLPTIDELPKKLQIQVEDTHAYVSWEPVGCNAIFGPILYRINVTNLVTNISKEIGIQTESTVTIDDLEPFTAYTLEITTARNLKYLQNEKNVMKMSLNFKTQAGLAPPVKNLELYSVGQSSVSLRYDLGGNARGKPAYIQVNRCSAITLTKCKSKQSTITACNLWPNKYCMDINNLIPNQKYTFRVSIKNEHTHVFGPETTVSCVLGEQVPGAPRNVSYAIAGCESTLDYCHLNISWLHPYYQNGTITSFHIVLNATEANGRNIYEVLKITNGTYMAKYNYQVKFIPYSTHYELYIQSVNEEYKSQYAHIHVKTADIGEHINQSLTIMKNSPHQVIFKLPTFDRRLKSYSITTIVQDYNKNKTIPEDILQNKPLRDHLCLHFGTTWVLPVLTIEDNKTEAIIVGENDPINRYLDNGTKYCFTFIIKNLYKNTEHDVVYYKKLTTLEEASAPEQAASSSYNHLYILLLLLLLVPAGFLLYRCMKRRRARPKQQQVHLENMYESMPFDEVENNCVSNETYDKLLHN